MKTMKNFFLLMALTIISVPAFSYSADLFEFDEQTFNESFNGVSELESFLLENHGVTLSELEASGSPLLNAVDLSMDRSSLMSSAVGYQAPLGIPSFLWGFCLGAVGILIVYLISESRDETIKALWGCIASVALYFLFWLVYAIILGASGFLFF
ncbi:MAG: hypothetical protein EA412_12180 [Chitinophagaceae bacterium]|nr:MAG: hypothetical protein EA412_12180 [Chitinophagaceae bacterium]